jgi:hypothetical protein
MVRTLKGTAALQSFGNGGKIKNGTLQRLKIKQGSTKHRRTNNAYSVTSWKSRLIASLNEENSTLFNNSKNSRHLNF